MAVRYWGLEPLPYYARFIFVRYLQFSNHSDRTGCSWIRGSTYNSTLFGLPFSILSVVWPMLQPLLQRLLPFLVLFVIICTAAALISSVCRGVWQSGAGACGGWQESKDFHWGVDLLFSQCQPLSLEKRTQHTLWDPLMQETEELLYINSSQQSWSIGNMFNSCTVISMPFLSITSFLWKSTRELQVSIRLLRWRWRERIVHSLAPGHPMS